MNSIRRYFAIVSICILILAAAFAFLNLQGTSSPPPALLDPDFALWTQVGNVTQPMVWVVQSNGAQGQVMVSRSNFNGGTAVNLTLYQNATTSRGTFVSLTETLDGARLTQVMGSRIGLWVFKEACNCDSDPFGSHAELLSVQINDGTREVSFTFTDQLAGSLTFLAHRVVFVPTPSGQWVYREVNFGREYSLAGWPMPTAVTFSLYFELGSKAVGWHSAFISNITTHSITQSVSVVSAEISFFDFAVGHQTFKVRENLAMTE